ncbi:MAG: hypothetical protein IKO42_05035, partial [Opitutales bacterium]|nr:hypothetical protein [Opitutales bacterium]
MIKKFLFVFTAAALFCGTSLAAVSITEADAQNAARQMFDKKATFAETYKDFYDKFAKFRAEQESIIKKAGTDYGSWRKIRQKDGTYVFTRTISAKKNIQTGVSFNFPGYAEIFFNGEKVGENKQRNQTRLKYLVLNLKKGENVLEMRT